MQSYTRQVNIIARCAVVVRTTALVMNLGPICRGGKIAVKCYQVASDSDTAFHVSGKGSTISPIYFIPPALRHTQLFHQVWRKCHGSWM